MLHPILSVFILSSCSYREYVSVVQYDLLVYDHKGARYQDIPVGDTISTSPYYNKFLPEKERPTPVKGMSPVLYKDYLLSAYSPIEFSRVVKTKSSRKSKLKRRRKSFRYVVNYPIYVRPAQKEDTPTASPSRTTGSGGGYRTIHTGPRGGKYYINKNGNKTYIKRRN